MEYDPRTCITAGQLRAAGAPVDDDLPDCAWVPWASVDYEVGKATGGPDLGSITCPITMTFSEPFRWVSLKLKMGPDGLEVVK